VEQSVFHGRQDNHLGGAHISKNPASESMQVCAVVFGIYDFSGRKIWMRKRLF